jgi:hypothetical protein
MVRVRTVSVVAATPVISLGQVSCSILHLPITALQEFITHLAVGASAVVGVASTRHSEDDDGFGNEGWRSWGAFGN